IRDRARVRIVESEQGAVDLDAIPGRLEVQAFQESLRREFAADAVVRRSFWREHGSVFANRRQTSRPIGVITQRRMRSAARAEAAGLRSAGEAGELQPAGHRAAGRVTARVAQNGYRSE